MKTYTYKYTGQEPVMLPNLGTVEHGQKVETGTKINHPMFEELKEEQPKEAK